MQAIPVTAGVALFGQGLSLQSIDVTRAVGELARGSIGVGVRVDSRSGVPIGRETAEDFVEFFNRQVFSKDDFEPDVVVSVRAPQVESYVGYAVGCTATTDASGAASFRVAMTEVNLALSSMNLGAYPSQHATEYVGLAEPGAMFVDYAPRTGSIGERILGLYEAAKEHYRRADGSDELEEIFASMRAQNARVEGILRSTLERSDTSPEWVDELNDIGSTRLNSMLSQVMFSGNNLWDSLLQIANACGLLYVGSMGFAGGRFRPLGEGESSYALVSPIAGINYTVGQHHIQPVGQVIAFAPYDEAARTAYVALSAQRPQDLRALARFPDTPSPANGKVQPMMAPAFLRPSNVIAEAPTSTSLEDGATEADAEQVASDATSTNAAIESEAAETLPALRKWCQTQYRLLNSSGSRVVAKVPFSVVTQEPGDVVTVGGMQGTLARVSHHLKVSGNSGTASTDIEVNRLNSLD